MEKIESTRTKDSIEIISYSNLLQRDEIISKERRRHKRVGYNEKFIVTSNNSNTINLKVSGVDLSVTGIGFISEEEFKKYDMLEIMFHYKGVSIPTILRVVHSNLYDQGIYTGGEFVALKNMYRDILLELLNK